MYEGAAIVQVCTVACIYSYKENLVKSVENRENIMYTRRGLNLTAGLLACALMITACGTEGTSSSSVESSELTSNQETASSNIEDTTTALEAVSTTVDSVATGNITTVSGQGGTKRSTPAATTTTATKTATTTTPKREYYSSKVGMWYTVWWDSEEKDIAHYQGHWINETRVKPIQHGYYATDDQQKLKDDYTYFTKIGIDYLILDDTNAHGADGGNIATHINACFQMRSLWVRIRPLNFVSLAALLY